MIENAKRELYALMKIPSPSGGELEIIEYLEMRLRKMGYSPEIQYSGDIINLILGDSDIVIATHVDTIQNRAKFKEKNGVIYGTGSCDAKGSIASILLFLENIENLNISIAFFSDEEDGGKGSEIFLEHIKPEGAIILEPTSLKLCTSHAGNIEVEFTASGKEAHGSCVEEGINAIEQAIDMYIELKSLEDMVNGAGYHVSFQEISAENPYYLIPDKCSGRIEFRLPPEENAETFIKYIEKILEKFCGKYYFREIWSGYTLAENHPLVRLFRKAGVYATDWMKSWTDALNFHKRGVPAVVFGPGDLHLAHTREEHIVLRDVVYTAEILERINRYAGEFYR